MFSLRRYRKILEEYNVFERCAKCGTCTYVYGSWAPACPAFNEFKFLTYSLGGKLLLAWGYLNGRLKLDQDIARVFYSCTLCGNCAYQCQITETDGTRPIKLYAITLLEAMRKELVRVGLGPMPEQKRVWDWILKEHNPYMAKHEDRSLWFPKDVVKGLPEKAEIVYFVGCTSAYIETEIIDATMRILNRLKVDYTILKDEWCCGLPLIRTGAPSQLVDEVVNHNIAAIEDAGADMIVTSCPGCYRVWKEDLADRHDFKVMHTVELVAEAIERGELTFKKPLKAKVTYHDPCDLGRHCGVFEPPRKILKSIPGVELIEMERSRENSWCCGAGGAVAFWLPEFTMNTACERIREAEETGASLLVSACPGCAMTLKNAIKEKGSRIMFRDITELILEHL